MQNSRCYLINLFCIYDHRRLFVRSLIKYCEIADNASVWRLNAKSLCWNIFWMGQVWSDVKLNRICLKSSWVELGWNGKLRELEGIIFFTSDLKLIQKDYLKGIISGLWWIFKSLRGHIRIAVVKCLYWPNLSTILFK